MLYRLQAACQSENLDDGEGASRSRQDGYRLVGMTLAKTAFGGEELVCIVMKG